MAEIVVRTARGEEHETLSALALRSKGHWGYSAEFLELCRPELTFSPADCAGGSMWVATSASQVLGFSLLRGAPPVGELTALFVDPAAIGTGCGRVLLLHLLEQASSRGFQRLELDADPGAEPFYRHFGAVRTGEVPSGSVPGRMIPQLEFRLP